MSRPPVVLFLAAAAVGSLAACAEEGPAPAAGELETVEVAPPPDALVRPENDPVERRRESPGGVSGVLPGGFPSQLPLPAGSTLTDFGDGPEGPWVELTVPTAAATLRRTYPGRLQAAGWASVGADTWRRDGTTVTVSITAAGPSARVRIHY